MMLLRLMGAMFAPKYPRHYTGRHRAPARLWPGIPRQRSDEPFDDLDQLART